jgi:hypothetical protein
MFIILCLLSYVYQTHVIIQTVILFLFFILVFTTSSDIKWFQPHLISDNTYIIQNHIFILFILCHLYSTFALILWNPCFMGHGCHPPPLKSIWLWFFSLHNLEIITTLSEKINKVFACQEKQNQDFAAVFEASYIYLVYFFFSSFCYEIWFIVFTLYYY